MSPTEKPDAIVVMLGLNDRMAMREPTVALQDRWSGQLYWYDGSHVGHIFSRRVYGVTERFLAAVAAETAETAETAEGFQR